MSFVIKFWQIIAASSPTPILKRAEPKQKVSHIL
jgi:hypothetical protein